MAQNQGQLPVISIISDKLASALLDLALGLMNSLLPSLQLLPGPSVVMSSPASSEGDDCSLFFLPAHFQEETMLLPLRSASVC